VQKFDQQYVVKLEPITILCFFESIH